MNEAQRLDEWATPLDAPELDAGELRGPATDHTVWSCVGNLTAVRSIRGRVREFLSLAGYASGTVDDAELAVSELATNALLHSRSGQLGGVMTLFIRVDSECVRIAVADQGEKEAESMDTEGADGGPLREEEGDYGRGKLIIDNCTSRSGDYLTGSSHVAWVEIDTGRTP